MIVVDTNVLSEPLKPAPEPRVVEWLAHHGEQCAITAVTMGELLSGARMLPHGQRRDVLLTAVEDVLGSFPHRILPYDAAASRRYAEFQERRRTRGVPLTAEDGMIAAIAAVTGAAVATRNVDDFGHLGLEVINPWS